MNNSDEKDDTIPISSWNAKRAIFPPIDNVDHYDGQINKEEKSLDNYDPNRVF